MGFEDIKMTKKERPERLLTEAESFLAGKYPAAARILERLTARDIAKLEEDTKSASGGGYSFNDLPGLYGRTSIPLVLDWQELTELIKKWKEARVAEKPNATANEIYEADNVRLKIARQISNLLEDA